VSSVNQTMLLQLLQHFVNLLIPQVHQIHNFFDCENDIGNSIFITPDQQADFTRILNSLSTEYSDVALETYSRGREKRHNKGMEYEM
jgi:hypothetical protein